MEELSEHVVPHFLDGILSLLVFLVSLINNSRDSSRDRRVNQYRQKRFAKPMQGSEI